jgi:ubiquitin-protein ligase
MTEQEYAEIQSNPLEGVSIQPIDSNMFKWNIELTGPKESPYAVCFSCHTTVRCVADKAVI